MSGSLYLAERAAADIADGAADQAGTDHLAEAAAGDHADAGAERTARNRTLLPDDMFSQPPRMPAIASITNIFLTMIFSPLS